MAGEPEQPHSAADSTSKSSGFEELCLDAEAINESAEKRLIRKCDLHVVPVISLLYMLAFIDRINIGNARIQGLEQDLHMEGSDYNVALFVFFIPYILFEVPSNIIIRKLAPSTWLSLIMFCWGESRRLIICYDHSLTEATGVVTVCQGITSSYAGLVVCRFFLGLFEAGFFPGGICSIRCYVTSTLRPA